MGTPGTMLIGRKPDQMICLGNVNSDFRPYDDGWFGEASDGAEISLVDYMKMCGQVMWDFEDLMLETSLASTPWEYSKVTWDEGLVWFDFSYGEKSYWLPMGRYFGEYDPIDLSDNYCTVDQTTVDDEWEKAQEELVEYLKTAMPVELPTDKQMADALTLDISQGPMELRIDKKDDDEFAEMFFAAWKIVKPQNRVYVAQTILTKDRRETELSIWRKNWVRPEKGDRIVSEDGRKGVVLVIGKMKPGPPKGPFGAEWDPTKEIIEGEGGATAVKFDEGTKTISNIYWFSKVEGE